MTKLIELLVMLVDIAQVLLEKIGLGSFLEYFTL